MKIDHVALYVRDLEGAKDFFVKYFQAVPSEQYHNPKTDFKSYFLSFDSGTRLEIMTRRDCMSRMTRVCAQVLYICHLVSEIVKWLTSLLQNLDPTDMK